jgi:hypothetical protein
MISGPKVLLSSLRSRGRIGSIARVGEMVCEFEGQYCRCFHVFVKNRHAGAGPWRVREIEKPRN